jgi:imidazolonepropionase-like amidohydrolase
VKYGTPVPEALEAVTLRPARLLGVDKLAGSIEVGKDADLVILTGDPLKISTWVQTTLVRGQVVYEREKDRKLQHLLQVVPQTTSR